MTRTRRGARGKIAPRRRTPWAVYVGAAALVLAVGAFWYISRGGGGGAGASTAQSLGTGARGELRSVATLRAPDYHSLAFSPIEPNTLFFGHHNGIRRSDDGGRTWSSVVERPNLDAMNLGAHPAAPNVLWMAGHEVLQRSTDGGKSWSSVRTNLPGLDLHAFAVSSADPNVLYAFAAGLGLFRSADAGATWAPVPAPPVIALATGGNPESLYVATQQGVIVSRDGGASFSSPVPVGSSPVLALAAAPAGDAVYAGTAAGLYRSDDGGATWRPTSYRGDVAALAAHPSDPERIALVDRQGRVFVND